MADLMPLPTRGTDPVKIGAVDLGGSHVSVAVVDVTSGKVLPGTVRRDPLDPHAGADALVAGITAAMAGLDTPELDAWGLAVPGPFDYCTGVAQYRGVGKFDALNGVDLRAALGAELYCGPRGLAFLNDADAFALGEWAAGALRGADCCIGLTLGSGVGSAFLRHGSVVAGGTDVPPEGSVHLLTWQGAPLEDTVSRRALRAAYSGSDSAGPDLAELADLVRGGDAKAGEVFFDAFYALGAVLGPWVRSFQASDVVLGGSVSRSWDVVVPPLEQGLQATGVRPRLLPAHRLDESAFVGAALHAVRQLDHVLPDWLLQVPYTLDVTTGELESA